MIPRAILLAFAWYTVSVSDGLAAESAGHWAFKPISRPPVPSSATGTNPLSNPIDVFIAAGLAAQGLSFSKEAPAHTLARRVSFDLTGLPPTAEDCQRLSHNMAPLAWDRYVDQLLASTHFGERMAMWWLDAARYADTDGYQSDDTRSNWPWRDWVIDAFNANMPFDQFTLEQFAGDLLPHATPEQRLATCFHRNHMTNGEGGRDPEESRVDYVIDRVNTLGTVWLGLTLSCAQCHSHKYDPISQADYYSLSAFFNSIAEDGKAGRAAKPYLDYPSPRAARHLAEAEGWLKIQEAAERQARNHSLPTYGPWLDRAVSRVQGAFIAWETVRPLQLQSVEGTQLRIAPDGIIVASGLNPRQEDYRLAFQPRLRRVAGLRLEVFPLPESNSGAYSRGTSGEFILTDIKVQIRRRGDTLVRDVAVNSAVADYSSEQKGDRVYGDIKGVLDDDPRNGWTTRGGPTNATHVAVFAMARPMELEQDEELIFELRQRSTVGDANIGRFRLSTCDQPGAAVRRIGPTPLERLAQVHPTSPTEIPEDIGAELFEQFLADHAPYQTARGRLERAKSQVEEARKATAPLPVMVLEDRSEPRATHVLLRGNWEKPGKRVQPGIPEAVAPWRAGTNATRVDLARWIVSPENPLTARVVANHLWNLCFGAGLVRTPEDFGSQGEPPTHPELLDWLAAELRDSGWNVKRLMRLMVTSRAYRQASTLSPELLARDPANRWLTRAHRFRWPSWMLRDAALRYAGNLNPALGGPPVRPHQPEGLWEENFMGRFTYAASEGAAQHRRSLYAFWRRTIAPVFLFDSAQRRVCEVRTPRTNTPLQALALLNDENYLEASRAMADVAEQRATQPESQIEWLHQRVLGRVPAARELNVLLREYHRALGQFEADVSMALRFLKIAPHSPAPASPKHRAALTVVASLILNLDETLTHE